MFFVNEPALIGNSFFFCDRNKERGKNQQDYPLSFIIIMQNCKKKVKRTKLLSYKTFTDKKGSVWKNSQKNTPIMSFSSKKSESEIGIRIGFNFASEPLNCAVSHFSHFVL